MSSAEPEEDQRWQDAESSAERPAGEPEQAGMAGARARAELESLRVEHGAVEEQLRSTREAVAEALRELELTRAERDAARRDAESAQAERDQALEATREHLAEQARLTGRVRQLVARVELLRADATRPGTDPRLRELESEREQLTTHVRALAELLSNDERSGDAGGGAQLGRPLANGAGDRLEAIRARAVRDANEHAERELRRLRAGPPL